jgi:predicted nicotinamide N-methyase
VQIVSQFLSDIKSVQTSDSVKLLALLCVGDIGSSHDLSGLVDLKALIDGAAGWPSEDVRAAGAQAIGMNAARTPVDAAETGCAVGQSHCS